MHCNRSSIHYIMPFVEGLDLGGRRRLLLDVPPLPPDGALGVHDLVALGREPRRAALGVLGERLLGRHPRVRRDVGRLLRRGRPLPLAEAAPPRRPRPRAAAAPSARAPPRADRALGGALRRDAVRGLRLDRDRARLGARHGARGSSARWASRAGTSRCRSWTSRTTRCRRGWSARRSGGRSTRTRSSRATGTGPRRRSRRSRNLWYHSGDAGYSRRRGLLRLQGPAQGLDPPAGREHLLVRGRAGGARRSPGSSRRRPTPCRRMSSRPRRR